VDIVCHFRIDPYVFFPPGIGMRVRCSSTVIFAFELPAPMGKPLWPFFFRLQGVLIAPLCSFFFPTLSEAGPLVDERCLRSLPRLAGPEGRALLLVLLMCLSGQLLPYHHWLFLGGAFPGASQILFFSISSFQGGVRLKSFLSSLMDLPFRRPKTVQLLSSPSQFSLSAQWRELEGPIPRFFLF